MSKKKKKKNKRKTDIVPEFEVPYPASAVENIPPPSNTSPSSSPSQTETMEVHHHPPHHGKKKFREYLFEFFMLFLAVFMGFIAENLRENFVERHRERDFASSLIRDLKADTTMLSAMIAKNEDRAKSFDSLTMELKKQPLPENANYLYYHFLPSTYYAEFVSTRRTISQLENAGYLRLFKDHRVSDTITGYYEHVKQVEGQFATFMRYFDIYHEQAFKVFAYSQIDTDFWHRETILNEGRQLTLITNDPETIEIFKGKLFVMKTITQLYNNDMRSLYEQATGTLSFIQSEYIPE